MFDEISTHVLNDSAPQLVYPLGADPDCRAPIQRARRLRLTGVEAVAAFLWSTP